MMHVEEQFIKNYDYPSEQFINTSLIEHFPFWSLDEEYPNFHGGIDLKENEMDNPQDKGILKMSGLNEFIPIENKNLNLNISKRKGQNYIKFESNKFKQRFKKKIIFISKGKRRGPKKKKLGNKRTHTKYAKENVNIKLKINTDNCIRYYLNNILRYYKKNICINHLKKFEFLKIAHKNTIKSINTVLKSLENKNLGDIINGKVSKKYGKKGESLEEHNIDLFKQLQVNEFMTKIFSEKYFHFFKNIFYKSERRIEVEINKNETILIEFPENIKLFNDLLKNEDKKYQKVMKYNALKYFMPGSIFITN